MFNIQKYIAQAVLAAGLAAASLTAAAGVLPTFKIAAADTATADIASIDVVFSSINGAALVTSSLTNFMGTPLLELDRQGAVRDIAGGGFAIDNTGSYNDLYLEVDGPFAFDLKFSEDFLAFNNPSNNNGFFSIVLYDSLGNLVGDPFGTLQFSVSNTNVTYTATSSLLSVTPAAAVTVPEPADLLLMLTGLGLIACTARRKVHATPRRMIAA